MDHSSTRADAVTSPAPLLAELAILDAAPEAWLQRLLDVQCRIGPAVAAALLRAGGDARVDLLARWPADLPTDAGWLRRAAEIGALALRERSAIEATLDGDGPRPTALVAVPLAADRAGLVGVYLLGTSDAAAVQRVRERLELTSTLTALHDARAATRHGIARLGRMTIAVESAAAVHAATGAREAAMALVGEVAARLELDRAAVGMLRGREVEVVAMSHADRVTPKMELCRALASVMEECLDQDIEVVVPAPAETGIVDRAAETFRRAHGSAALAALPIRVGGEAAGVLTVERGTPVVEGDLAVLRLVLELVGPRLVELHAREAPLPARLLATAQRGAGAIVGPRHALAKLVAAIALAALLLLALMPIQRTARGAALVEPAVRRVVAAPFDGTLATASASIDDRVVAGETLLATLRTDDLRLELAAATAEAEAARTEAAAARDEGRLAQAALADARLRRAEAAAGLLEHRLAEARLVAPIDGVVAAGELERSIGAPVRAGQPLFEIVRPGAVVVRVAVPESRLGDVEVGQRATLTLAARPGTPIEGVVARLEPVARVVDGRNALHVDVELDDAPPAWLRPGMEGAARIATGRTTPLAAWTRDVRDWLRLRLWW